MPTLPTPKNASKTAAAPTTEAKPPEFTIVDDERNPGRKLLSKTSAGGIKVSAGSEVSIESMNEAKTKINIKIDKLDAAGAYADAGGYIVRPDSVAHLVQGDTTPEEAQARAENDALRAKSKADRAAADAADPKPTA